MILTEEDGLNVNCVVLLKPMTNSVPMVVLMKLILESVKIADIKIDIK